MAEYKYRFMMMMKTHSPMKRSSVTRRALGQLRGMTMVALTKLLNELEALEFIKIAPLDIEGLPGRRPDVIEITKKGLQWINDQVKINQKALRRLK